MKKEEEKKRDSSFAEGAISILSVLQHHSRPIFRILVLPDVKKEETNLGKLFRLAKKEKIPIELSSPAFFESVTTGHTHGGVIAEVGSRKMLSPEEVFAPENGFVFLLCGLEDPFNFGCAVRSFYAAGATGMVLTPRNWLSAAGVTIRSSAGATEAVPCAVAEDNEALIALARARGYRVVCASEKDSTPLFSADLKKPLFLIVGGEKRGITKDLLKASDLRVRIPYGRNFSASLTASGAAAVCAFEVFRQNQICKGEGI